MITKYKKNNNNLNKGGAENSYNPSNPVDAHFSTGFSDQPSQKEFKNTHGCPFVVNVRNGGENDMKTKIRASKVLTSPNLEGQSEHPLKTELENTHVYPSVSYRNGGENDMKTIVGASDQITGPKGRNEFKPISFKAKKKEYEKKCQSILDNTYNWSVFNNSYQARNELNISGGIYVYAEVDHTHGIIVNSNIGYVGLTTRTLGKRTREHNSKKIKPGFINWVRIMEKQNKLKIYFKSFPKKYLEGIEEILIEKLNPIFNISKKPKNKKEEKKNEQVSR